MKIRLIPLAAAALAVPPAAAAHITASPAELAAGYTYAELSVPHGCDGSATTKVSVKIPAGIASVKPQEVAGWEIETTKGTLEQPVTIFGEETTEGVTEVSWTGGPLPDDHMQRFGLSFFAADSLAGETVYFPTVQECEQGVTRWIEIPVEGEEPPQEPAPGIAFLASAEEPSSDDAADAAESDAEAAPAAAVEDGADGLALGFGIAGLAAGLLALAVALFRPGLAARRR